MYRIIRFATVALVISLASACATSNTTDGPRTPVLNEDGAASATRAMNVWAEESRKLDVATYNFVESLKVKPFNATKAKHLYRDMQDQAEAARVARKDALNKAAPLVDRAKRTGQVDDGMKRLVIAYKHAKAAFDGALKRHKRVVRAVQKLARR